MEIYAKIKGIKYKPLLSKPLTSYTFDNLDKALSEKTSFILKIINKHEVALSWWVSPKRTRSYPYARIYDTLNFAGKKATIIPIIKDEGKQGDRDFLQWDTISLMSLLGIYVIVSYYIEADRSLRYKNKITNQKFDTEHIKNELKNLLSYQSDALHWNLEYIDNISNIADRAFEAYKSISKKLGVEMHSFKTAQQRINKLHKGKKEFMKLSRRLARKAQLREYMTMQPKEHLTGSKATITIKNYLGGYYYFTCDEVEIDKNKIYLIEAKHTKKGTLPSEADIKDGLIKMILFTNLKDVVFNGHKFLSIPILKLTTETNLSTSLTKPKYDILNLLKKEAKFNNFKVKINNKFIV